MTHKYPYNWACVEQSGVKWFYEFFNPVLKINQLRVNLCSMVNIATRLTEKAA